MDDSQPAGARLTRQGTEQPRAGAIRFEPRLRRGGGRGDDQIRLPRPASRPGLMADLAGHAARFRRTCPMRRFQQTGGRPARWIALGLSAGILPGAAHPALPLPDPLGQFPTRRLRPDDSLEIATVQVVGTVMAVNGRQAILGRGRSSFFDLAS